MHNHKQRDGLNNLMMNLLHVILGKTTIPGLRITNPLALFSRDDHRLHYKYTPKQFKLTQINPTDVNVINSLYRILHQHHTSWTVILWTPKPFHTQNHLFEIFYAL